ncbi:ArsR family transcriptional regulator [Piscinibacter sp. Jin2]|uniref:ArsR family transcriptional regulator n=1 Tax=Aquariibacter lacus TaxID=2801332 RepID=A0A9X0XBY2_9BURK|nr:ArsR family transcriptional regulator [Piscinibacter lacus]MBL0718596.1 ArsR family transcriptional regulator [Piscinibacter lacus]
MKTTDRAEALRRLLARGPATPQQLVEKLGISQPTLSRALAALGDEVLRLGAARSIHYLLRDSARGLPPIPVYRVTAEGQVARLGLLGPVASEGFLMQEDDGKTLHSEGLPWWLLDMRPQGFVGRAYAARHAQALGLPPNLAEWSDTQALRALLVHGHDAVGNLLLGD